KFERVLRRAGVPDTVRRLEALLAETRARLLGVPVPLVLYHADLRAKHVQVGEDGALAGFLDWGSSEDADLPWFDLANLILHDRKQERGGSAASAWRLLAEGRLRDFEERALADLALRLALPRAYTDPLRAIHPVLVGAMAEKNWDYSRPRWLHRQFGV
ncbi:MAG TPA: phosphotransferase, partial [Planctomycetota bacterium]|nr:phosphotransferase [Planctomycetota bacterium]